MDNKKLLKCIRELEEKLNKEIRIRETNEKDFWRYISELQEVLNGKIHKK